MSSLLIGGPLDIGRGVIGNLFPNPKDAAEAEMKMQELAQNGDLAELQAYVTLMSGQLEINKEEAKSGSLFVAGWRPAIGWTCAVALFAAYVPKALIITGLWATQTGMMMADTPDMATFILPPFPDLGLTDLIGLLMSMLGIGAMRSFDKSKKTDTQRINK